MSQLTDANIIISCSDCHDHTEQGVENMLAHILSEHKSYSNLEAHVYALKWLEHAWDEEDLRQERATKAEHQRRAI